MPLIILLTLALLSGCVSHKEHVYEIEIYNDVGDQLGEVTFKEVPDGVNMKIDIEGLSSGYHGLHIHENPECEGPKFITAGDHLNPDDNKHGLLHPKGSHLGDLPNIEVDGSGKVDVELIIPKATLKEGRYSLVHNDGSSLIITEDPEDGMTQPSGESGERIACGVLKENDS